jgi:hypothetical protein
MELLLLLSIFGYKKESEHDNYFPDIICIESLICIWEDSFYFISHLAVSDKVSGRDFGHSFDGKTFWKRGLGKVLVGVCHYFTQKLSGPTDMCCQPYRHPDEKDVINSEHNLWLQLGFSPYSGALKEGVVKIIVNHHVVNTGYKYFGVPLMLIRSSSVSKCHLYAIKDSTESDTYIEVERNFSGDIRDLYKSQLRGTDMRFEKIPEEVFRSYRSDDSFDDAIKFALSNVKEKMEKELNQFTFDESEGEFSCEDTGFDDNCVYLTDTGHHYDEFDCHPSRQYGKIYDEVECFLKTLKGNRVFDMGFRLSKETMELCWCPW